MTLTADGSGRIGARLVIEGLDYEFVTDSTMVGSGSDSRLRKLGLLLDGLVIDNGADMLSGKIDAKGMTARIADIDGAATYVFARNPSAVTYMGQTTTTGATTLYVQSTSSFAASGFVHVGTECIQYSGKTSTTFTGLTRARRDTIAQAHYTADGERTVRAEVTDIPATIEGRRAYLFVYSDNLSPTGDGTQRFEGVVSRDATLEDGVHWTVQIDPITRVLAAGVGDDIAIAPTIRGIYYPWNGALSIQITENTGANASDPVNSARTVSTRIVGFWESQSEFIAYLNATLDTLTSSWASWKSKATAIEMPDGTWTFQIRTDSSALWLNVFAISPIDHVISCSPAGYTFVDSYGDFIVTAAVAVDTVYTIAPVARNAAERGQVLVGGYPSAVPRAFFASPNYESYTHDPCVSTVPADRTNYPANRAYLSSASVDGFTVLNIGGSDTEEPICIPLDASLADATDRYVVAQEFYVRFMPTTTRAIALVDAVPLQPERLFQTDMFGNDGLAGFLDFVIPESQDICDIAGLPLLQSRGGNSIFENTYGTVIAAAQGGRPYATQRAYRSVKKAKFDAYLAEEVKLLGLFMRLNVSGRIEFAPITLAALTEASTYSIDASSELVSVQWSSWERNAFGSLNELRLLTGYDPDEDKHLGTMYKVFDLASLARNKTPRVMEIAPKSIARAQPTLDDIQRLAGSSLGVYGRPYAIATVAVPWTLFDAVPGNTISITSTTLPNSSGTRGTTDVQGIVLSRRWDLMQASGTLTILVHGQNIAGYAPSVYISSQVNTSGNTWEIYCDTGSAPFEANGTLFPAGTRVRVVKWNDGDDSGDTSGIVASTIGTQIVVTFDGVWVPGANTWVLNYDDSDAALATTAQLRYAYIATSGAQISLTASTTPARTFAP